MNRIIKKVASVFLSTGIIMTSLSMIGNVAQAADFSATYDLVTNTGMQGSINKGYGYGSNTYRVTLPVAGSLTVNFTRPQQKDKNGYWEVKLYNEEYIEIDSRVMYGNDCSTDMTTEGLPAGTYYIEVESTSYGEASSDDTYTVTAKYERSGYWEQEFNENFKSANEINIGAVYSGTTRSGYGYEADYYKFNVSKDGMYEINMMTPQQGNTDKIWNMYLYDDGYTEAAETGIYGNKTDQMIKASLVQGTYYIGVNSTSYGEAASTDVYQLRIDGDNDVANGEYNIDDWIDCDPADDAANTGNAQVGGGGQINDDNIGGSIIEIRIDQDQAEKTVVEDTTDKVGETKSVENTESVAVGSSLLTIIAKKSVLEVGDDQILDVELPDGYDGSDLVWDTSDDDVLDIDDDGVVTAVAPGQAAVTACTEDGKYAGICVISVKMPRITITKVKGKKRAITVEWNRPICDVDGYQIQYSYKKNFDSARSVYAKDGKDIYKKISGLSKNRRVYVRICAYAKVSGSKYTGEWSKVKSARTWSR